MASYFISIGCYNAFLLSCIVVTNNSVLAAFYILYIILILNCNLQLHGWRGGATCSVGLAINRSWVQILLGAKLRYNIWQVVHTYVPLSPSSITWYRPRGGDALRLGR